MEKLPMAVLQSFSNPKESTLKKPAASERKMSAGFNYFRDSARTGEIVNRDGTIKEKIK
jgi:hypothetical protein